MTNFTTLQLNTMPLETLTNTKMRKTESLFIYKTYLRLKHLRGIIQGTPLDWYLEPTYAATLLKEFLEAPNGSSNYGKQAVLSLIKVLHWKEIY